jgi:D-glycero-D-manno-heptose 1,7-bisphosphate phosphatase
MSFETLNTLRKAVFVDRDGVVNYEIDRGDAFVTNGKKIRWTAPFVLEELKLYPDAVSALELMRRKDYMTILVTNQPDVSTGNMRSQDLETIMAAIYALPFDVIWACKHHPHCGCFCRKPSPGMIYAAGVVYNVDPKTSYMLGDRETDVQAGKAAGVRTIRVTASDDVETAADHRVRGIMEAAQILP